MSEQCTFVWGGNRCILSDRHTVVKRPHLFHDIDNYGKLTRMQIATTQDILRAAEQMLMTGWVRYAGEVASAHPGAPTRYCMAGAIAAAHHALTGAWHSYIDSELSYLMNPVADVIAADKQASRDLHDVIGHVRAVDLVTLFNDHAADNIDDVLRIMREAIASFDVGPQLPKTLPANPLLPATFATS